MLPAPTRLHPHRALRIAIVVLGAIALLTFLIRTAAM